MKEGSVDLLKYPEYIGKAFRKRVAGFLYGLGFFFQVLKESLLFFKRGQVGYKVLILQILFTGVEALTIIALIALALGIVIIIQGLTLLPQFGQGNLLYGIIITIITRELGPILTAFIVTARSGTAIATEIGGMVVSHEIEAYLATGINPISYLVVPRFVGMVVSVFLLNIYFNLFGLGGSFLVTQLFNPISVYEYGMGILSTLTLKDLISSAVKSIAFGTIISVTASFHGFRVTHSTTEIPQVAIKAVGQSFTLCILVNAVITLIYYI